MRYLLLLAVFLTACEPAYDSVTERAKREATRKAHADEWNEILAQTVRLCMEKGGVPIWTYGAGRVERCDFAFREAPQR